jgi:ABC-2 type transport system permease protein
MNPSLTFATAGRVLTQLRRDHRTLGMIIVIPCLLVTLIKYVVGDDTWARIGLPLVGILPLVIMFLITSIAMLRERSSGTLERLMTLPSSKLDILLGYGLAFAAVAAVQSIVVSSVAIGLLDLDVEGAIPAAIGIAVINAVLGMALGLLASAFASSEFQAVQFMPAFLLPQIILCGLFAARDEMSQVLDVAAGALPMTYAFDALSHVSSSSEWTGDLVLDVLVVAGSAVAALALAAATLRRRTG